ncbi:MAG TPA: glutamine synthetase family protein [Methylomirabilota bacterium]|nr:glutamine synthetase family protein [Methylomirabilota bacterium]
MKLETLKQKVKSGEIDTVIVAFPDMLGRLVGKRFTGQFFIDEIADHGTHGCNYLLAVNMEMDPQEGFNIANWDKGFGDFHMAPDLSTLRVLPWLPATALVICDYKLDSGEYVAPAPRSVLRKALELVSKQGFTCNIASELEFYLFNTTYPQAFKTGYTELPPSSDYRIDYHIMQPGRDETLMRAIRNQMNAARVPVESSKGEWGRGQHEINFIYDRPIEMADMHVVFKQGVKEIADQHGKSITFMPKWSMNEAGNSCHIHISIFEKNRNIFWDDKKKTGSKFFKGFLAGLMKYSPELCYFYAPSINAYKRYQPGSWAPTKMAWSHDNRTVGFRVVGQGNSFRIENRMPGADANPYLAFAAMIIAGLAGVQEGLDCGESYGGNAYVDEKLAALPHSLSDAAALLNKSQIARRILGDDVVDYYVHTARLEVQAFDNAVTDWEKSRYFERI